MGASSSKRRVCEQQYETWERPVGWEEFQVCSRYVMKIVHCGGKCIDFDAIFEPHAMFKIKNELGDHVSIFYDFLETFYRTRIRALLSVLRPICRCHDFYDPLNYVRNSFSESVRNSRNNASISVL